MSSAREEFIQNCRLRNLSIRTITYYAEDLEYFIRCMELEQTDDITREVVDAFVLYEMDKGNRVTAITTRLRGLRVFSHFCAEREYLEGFKCPLLKKDQQVKKHCMVYNRVREVFFCGSLCTAFENFLPALQKRGMFAILMAEE